MYINNFTNNLILSVTKIEKFLADGTTLGPFFLWLLQYTQNSGYFKNSKSDTFKYAIFKNVTENYTITIKKIEHSKLEAHF